MAKKKATPPASPKEEVTQPPGRIINPDNEPDPTDSLAAGETAPEVQETCREYLRRNFTPEEMGLMGQSMARVDQEILRSTEEITSIKADFKGKITKLETERSDFSRKINAGYEMANIDCIVTRDHDRKMVIIHRADTGEFVRERKMTYDELQRSLLPPQNEAEVAAHFGVEEPPAATGVGPPLEGTEGFTRDGAASLPAGGAESPILDALPGPGAENSGAESPIHF